MSPFAYGNISYGATTLKIPPLGNIFFDAIRLSLSSFPIILNRYILIPQDRDRNSDRMW